MQSNSNSGRFDLDQLRHQARGQWLAIFQYLCPGVFDDAIRNLGSHVTCPFHGGEDDFRFVKKAKSGKDNTDQCGVAMCTCGPQNGSYSDGFAVLMRATGWSFRETLIEVNRYLNGESPQPLTPSKPLIVQPSKEDDAAEKARILGKVVSLFDAGKPLTVEEVPYYVERGLDPRIIANLRDVRFLKSLGYFTYIRNETTNEREYKKIGSYPAILVLMRDAQGNPVAIHRTWLSNDRKEKAPVQKAKKLSETTGASGAAMRLFAATGTTILGLTEGVETAIAAAQLAEDGYWPDFDSVPVWACYSEGNIRSFVIPKELLSTLKTIVVFADHDENGKGMEAAAVFKERMATEHPEIDVVIKLPPVAGTDWNDVLINL